MDRNMEMARRIAEQVSRAGGRTFYVGGYVRDQLLQIDNKDIDIEIHGITPRELCDILDTLGQRTVMGASFGIYGLSHYELDIAMPRTEKATGKGHKDFEVFVDPFQGTENAAKRRDLTINALMQDVLTGEIIDHFGGVADLKAGIIRHVNDETFAEDPLRVLRVAQFAARFGFAVAPETIRLSSQMDLSALPAERIMGELEKALKKAKKPSVFFGVLRQMDQLQTWFPELDSRKEVWDQGQGEASVCAYRQAMSALLDETALLCTQAHQPVHLMLSALYCTVARHGRDHAAGAERLVSRLTQDRSIHLYLPNMMALLDPIKEAAYRRACGYDFFRLFDRSICPEDLILLAVADAHVAGSPIKASELAAQLESYHRILERPSVHGDDLIAAGFQPGKSFKEALDIAHDLQLQGYDKEEALRQAIDSLKKQPNPDRSLTV